MKNLLNVIRQFLQGFFYHTDEPRIFEKKWIEDSILHVGDTVMFCGQPLKVIGLDHEKGIVTIDTGIRIKASARLKEE